jgi:CheY-like chemotaxis protein
MSGGPSGGWRPAGAVPDPVSVPRSILSRRILVVEDSPSARRLLQGLLLRLGVTLPNLRLAADTNEALQLFTSWQPEIAFVDLELRGSSPLPPPAGPLSAGSRRSNGAELAVEFLQRSPGLQVIICSASEPDSPALDPFRKKGRVHSLVKPVLASKVAEMLQRVSQGLTPASSRER